MKAWRKRKGLEVDESDICLKGCQELSSIEPNYCLFGREGIKEKKKSICIAGEQLSLGNGRCVRVYEITSLAQQESVHSNSTAPHLD